MKRLEKIFAWFFMGGILGLITGAIGGLMDRGSMMILMPSGSPFWAIVGGFFGSIAGAIYGAISKLPPQTAHYMDPDSAGENTEAGKDRLQL